MIKLKVSGMTCGHCARAVTNALSSVPGVDRVLEVSVERGEAAVEGEAEGRKLVEAVEAEGFRAELSA